MLPKTLLITSSRPGVGSVGEIFLGSLSKLFEHGQLFCFAAFSNAYDVPVPDEELGWLPIVSRALPCEYQWQYNENFIEKSIRKFRHFELLGKSLEPLVAEACQIIEKEHIEVLWLVLNSPGALMIADKVLKRFPLPSVAIVWDPIRHIVEQGKMDKRTRHQLELCSINVLSRVSTCGVASAPMKKLFENTNPALPTEVLICAPSADSELLPRNFQQGEVTIIFSGSLYARHEFLGLIAALSEMNWQLEGRRVHLKVFSAAFDIPIHAGGKGSNLTFGGYISETELRTELANADIAYLPYWFAPEYAEGVKRCFPAKLATYIAGGCPVLYHGPKDSSPTDFLRRFKVGKAVFNSDPKLLKDAVHYLTHDAEFLKNYPTERARALHEELGNELFRYRFKKLIGLAYCHTSGQVTSVAAPE